MSVPSSFYDILRISYLGLCIIHPNFSWPAFVRFLSAANHTEHLIASSVLSAKDAGHRQSHSSQPYCKKECSKSCIREEVEFLARQTSIVPDGQNPSRQQASTCQQYRSRPSLYLISTDWRVMFICSTKMVRLTSRRYVFR